MALVSSSPMLRSGWAGYASVAGERLRAGSGPCIGTAGAADQGDARGQFSAGDMCYDGEAGVSMDRAEAGRWYTLAAKQGHGEARQMLTWMAGGGCMTDLH